MHSVVVATVWIEEGADELNAREIFDEFFPYPREVCNRRPPPTMCSHLEKDKEIAHYNFKGNAVSTGLRQVAK